MITIKHRWTGVDLLTVNADTLTDADLYRANLYQADLTGANLRDADLRDADLRDANLSRANLYGADLSDANLYGADLSDANLSDANLSDANLSDANLSRANLSRANLYGTNLTGADLSAIRNDVRALLANAPNEVVGLRNALIAGRINGQLYDGDCACLVGTIAKIRGIDYHGLSPDSNRPAERWALAIQPGHTTDNSQIVAITVGWIDEWLAAHE